MPEPTKTAAEIAAAETKQAPPVDVAAVRAEATKAERTRIGAILGHAEAKGRTQLATALALESDLDAEAAGKIMAAAPKAGAEINLADLMVGVANPKVGAGSSADGDTEEAEIARICAVGNQMKGGK